MQEVRRVPERAGARRPAPGMRAKKEELIKKYNKTDKSDEKSRNTLNEDRRRFFKSDRKHDTAVLLKLTSHPSLK